MSCFTEVKYQKVWNQVSGLCLMAFLTIFPCTSVVADTSPILKETILEVIKQNPKAIIDAVNSYQKEQAKEEFREQLRQYVEQPAKVDIRNAPILGEQAASLTLVEFSDFQCPYCQEEQPILKALMEKYKGRMRIAYMHLPLPMHRQAKSAAQAAWAAGKQGKFFEYHDRLFALETRIRPGDYEQIAKDLDLNLEDFNRDRSSPQAVAQVEADVQQAERLGIQGTPSFVLNGIVLRGALPMSSFEEAIELLDEQKVSKDEVGE